MECRTWAVSLQMRYSAAGVSGPLSAVPAETVTLESPPYSFPIRRIFPLLRAVSSPWCLRSTTGIGLQASLFPSPRGRAQEVS